MQSSYGVSLAAAHERASEEARVRDKMAQKQQRRQAKDKEELRQRVLQLALHEAQRSGQTQETAAMLEEQKRFTASISVQRADERYALVRSDLSRRFYEPTPAEQEQREEDFQRRRVEHRLQREARVAQIEVRSTASCQTPLALLPSSTYARARKVEQLSKSSFRSPRRRASTSAHQPWQPPVRRGCLVPERGPCGGCKRSAALRVHQPYREDETCPRFNHFDRDVTRE